MSIPFPSDRLLPLVAISQVVNTVTALVEYLPEEIFVQQAPSSPPSLSSAHQSTDSIASDTHHSPQPVSAREAARSNIIRELVETERKYVQDLEVMQVWPCRALSWCPS
jgi:cell division control protein 24